MDIKNSATRPRDPAAAEVEKALGDLNDVTTAISDKMKAMAGDLDAETMGVVWDAVDALRIKNGLPPSSRSIDVELAEYAQAGTLGGGRVVVDD